MLLVKVGHDFGTISSDEGTVRSTVQSVANDNHQD